MTKPVTIKTKGGNTREGYYDESRRLLFTNYITAELAADLGWSWEEKEEQHGEP